MLTIRHWRGDADKICLLHHDRFLTCFLLRRLHTTLEQAACSEPCTLSVCCAHESHGVTTGMMIEVKGYIFSSQMEQIVIHPWTLPKRVKKETDSFRRRTQFTQNVQVLHQQGVPPAGTALLTIQYCTQLQLSLRVATRDHCNGYLVSSENGQVERRIVLQKNNHNIRGGHYSTQHWSNQIIGS